MADLHCPYCNKNLGHADDCYEPDDTYEYQCHECEKNFSFTLDYEVHYYEKKAPCLNGGEHEWRDVVGHPKVLFEGIQRCKNCNKQNKPLNHEAAFAETEQQLKEQENAIT